MINRDIANRIIQPKNQRVKRCRFCGHKLTFREDSVNCSSEKYEQTSSGIVLRTSTSCIIPYFRFCFHHFLPTGRLWLSPLICLLGC